MNSAEIKPDTRLSGRQLAAPCPASALPRPALFAHWLPALWPARALLAVMAALALCGWGQPAWAEEEEGAGAESAAAESTAAEESGDGESAAEDSGGVTELSGLTIVGAKETPKSLILVPWKDSNVDVTTDFGSLVDSVEIEPVDRPTLERKMLFDELTRADLEKERAAKAREAQEQADE